MSEEQQKVEGGGDVESHVSETTSVSGAEQQVGSEQKTPVAPMNPVAATVSQAAVTQGEKMWSVLAYLPLVSLMTLVVNPKSEFCRLHGTQGLVLFGIEFLTLFLAGISPAIIGLLWLVLFVLVIFSAFKAFSGEMFKIPGVYDLAKMIPVDSLVAGVATSSGTGGAAQGTQVSQQAPVEVQTQPVEVQSEAKVETEDKVETKVGGASEASSESAVGTEGGVGNVDTNGADSSESGNNEN